MKDIYIYTYVIALIYTPFYHTGANILSFEVAPPPPRKPTWPPFCGPDLFKFAPIFLTFSTNISYAYQISSSCNL